MKERDREVKIRRKRNIVIAILAILATADPGMLTKLWRSTCADWCTFPDITRMGQPKPMGGSHLELRMATHASDAIFTFCPNKPTSPFLAMVSLPTPIYRINYTNNRGVSYLLSSRITVKKKIIIIKLNSL